MDVSVVDKYACQYTDPISVAVTGYESRAYRRPDHVSDCSAARLRRGPAHARRGRAQWTASSCIIVIETPTAAEFQTFEPLAETLLSTLKFTP